MIINGRLLTDMGFWGRSSELTDSGKEVTTAFTQLAGHSFLRARWRTAQANAGGMIELGLVGVSPLSSVGLRYAYGWYRYGRCRILAGQTDNWFGSLAYHPKQYLGANNDGHLLLFGWGFLWPHRVPQVQLTISDKAWGVQVALEEPRYKYDWYGKGVDPYFTIPRISITGRFKAGRFMTHPGVSFVRHQIEGGPAKGDDASDTLAVVVPVMYASGPLTLKFQGHWGKNFYNEYPYYPDLTRPVFSSNNLRLQDTFVTGGAVSAEYRLGMLSLVAGVGYERFANDAWKRNGWKEDDTQRKAYFLAAPYRINRYFGVHPELAYYDYGDDPQTGKDGGSEWMAGVQFRFIF